MTQPPYRPSDDHATRRLVIFIAVFLVVVAVGAQTPARHIATTDSDVCHCLPSKAALMMKSAFAKAQAHSTALATLTRH